VDLEAGPLVLALSTFLIFIAAVPFAVRRWRSRG
jgi:hypothetical protein